MKRGVVAVLVGLCVSAATFLPAAQETRGSRTPKVAPAPDMMVSVWYNGGKARAPMLSPITPASRDEWRRDLQQIKSLGFNTVRGWMRLVAQRAARGSV